jgi:hypothetical protein
MTIKNSQLGVKFFSCISNQRFHRFLLQNFEKFRWLSLIFPAKFCQISLIFGKFGENLPHFVKVNQIVSHFVKKHKDTGRERERESKRDKEKRTNKEKEQL